MFAELSAGKAKGLRVMLVALAACLVCVVACGVLAAKPAAADAATLKISIAKESADSVTLKWKNPSKGHHYFFYRSSVKNGKYERLYPSAYASDSKFKDGAYMKWTPDKKLSTTQKVYIKVECYSSANKLLSTTIVEKTKVLKAGSWGAYNPDAKIYNLTNKKYDPMYGWMTVDQGNKVKKHIENAVKKAKITAKSSDWQKIKFAHDYICKMTNRAPDGAKNTVAKYKHIGTPYGALISSTHLSDCYGFSRTMKAFCDYLGVDCKIIQGKWGVPHWWVMVKCDGKWYQMDVRRDDRDNWKGSQKDGKKILRANSEFADYTKKAGQKLPATSKKSYLEVSKK